MVATRLARCASHYLKIQAKSDVCLSWVGGLCKLSSSLLISPVLRGFFSGYSDFPPALLILFVFRTTEFPLIPASLH